MKKQMRDLLRSIQPKQRKPKEIQRSITGGVAELSADVEGFTPPETRFTEEYRAFLEKMETVKASDENAD